MEEPYSVMTSIPLACPNIGPRMSKAAPEATGCDHLDPGGAYSATGIKPVD